MMSIPCLCATPAAQNACNTHLIPLLFTSFAERTSAVQARLVLPEARLPRSSRCQQWVQCRSAREKLQLWRSDTNDGDLPVFQSFATQMLNTEAETQAVLGWVATTGAHSPEPSRRPETLCTWKSMKKSALEMGKPGQETMNGIRSPKNVFNTSWSILVIQQPEKFSLTLTSCQLNYPVQTTSVKFLHLYAMPWVDGNTIHEELPGVGVPWPHVGDLRIHREFLACQKPLQNSHGTWKIGHSEKEK